MAVAQRFRYGRCLVEMQDVGVGVHLAHRFAIFHVDVGIFVFGVVFNGVAVLRFGTRAAHAHHFRTNHGVANHAKLVVGRNNAAVTCHDARINRFN